DWSSPAYGKARLTRPCQFISIPAFFVANTNLLDKPMLQYHLSEDIDKDSIRRLVHFHGDFQYFAIINIRQCTIHHVNCGSISSNAIVRTNTERASSA